MKKKFSYPIYIVTAISMLASSCKNWLEVPTPATSINAGNVFSSDGSAISAVTLIYAQMSSNTLSNYPSNVSNSALGTGLRGDELVYHFKGVGALEQHYTNMLISDPTTTGATYMPWVNTYNLIFSANAAIESLGVENKLTEKVRLQLLGESHFQRAYLYFYLVNLYGAVPLVLSTDPKVNETLPRTDEATVYAQIVTDLNEAVNLLGEEYADKDLLGVTNERVRPNRWAALALLARTYLYKKEYALAEQAAEKVLSQTGRFSLLAPDQVFLANSKETIWALQPVRKIGSQFVNAGESVIFDLTSSGAVPRGFGSLHHSYLSDMVYSQFETDDVRKTAWVGIYHETVTGKSYPFAAKYKTVTSATIREYSVVIRLAELYLIRSEARLKQNNVSGAREDLNAIRRRAGLGNITSDDQTVVMQALIRERKSELFTEGCHRWFDMIRLGIIDEVMTPLTPVKSDSLATWDPDQKLLPVPENELRRNPNLIQNPGY